jgi:Flp pilus assembly protein TadD
MPLVALRTVEQFQSAVELMPASARAFAGLIAALDRAGRRVDARAVLAKAERLFPGDATVLELKRALMGGPGG